MDVIIWIVIAILFIMLELFTNTLFLLCLGISSLAAGILNYLEFDINIQITAFIIMSIILILSTRKFAEKISPKNTKKSTAERLIGKEAKVIRKISENTFVVSVGGEEWSAHTNDSISIGETVKVVGIDSIVLIIEKSE